MINFLLAASELPITETDDQIPDHVLMSESDQCSRFSIPRPISTGLSEISETSHEPISLNTTDNTDEKQESSGSESTEYEEIEIEVTASESEYESEDNQAEEVKEKVPTPISSDKSDSNPTASSKSNSNSMKSVIESTAHLEKQIDDHEKVNDENKSDSETCSSSSEYEEIEIEVTDSDASTESESELENEMSKNNSNNSKHCETSLASISSFRDTTDRASSTTSEESLDLLETYSICTAKSFPLQAPKPSEKQAKVLERTVSQNSLNEITKQMEHFQQLGSNSSFTNLVGRDMRKSTGNLNRIKSSYRRKPVLRRTNSLQVKFFQRFIIYTNIFRNE